MKKGFTLLELIIVIIILGSIRTAQQAYYLERGYYADSLADLAVEAPTACTSTHYFRYTTIQTGATALRCTTNGKTPDVASPYFIILTFADGAWTGSQGYY